MSSDSEEEPQVQEEQEEEEEDLKVPAVVEKYKIASGIVNTATAGVLKQLSEVSDAGASVAQICDFGDALITEQVKHVYKAKKINKGLAFPTCISINECVGHYSPLNPESDTVKPGDVAKIDLGCHIDGYIAVVAHTVVVGSAATPTEGAEKFGDVITAASVAREVAIKSMRVGATNTSVTDAIARVAKTFGVTCMSGVNSHEMKRFVIDGNQVIALSQDPEKPEMKVDEFEFEEGEVYGLDIVMTSGDGRPKDQSTRTTVFKRAVEEEYKLKMRASRAVLSEVNKRFPTLPFTLRALDQKTARMGVVECVKHGLLTPYPVLYEDKGSHVAHLKSTVLLLPSGATKVTGEDVAPCSAKIDGLDEETKAILATSTKKKKRKKKKKGGNGGGEAAGDGEAAASK